MSFSRALASVKMAVATKALVPHLTHYLIRNGEVIATDGQVTAGAAFPDDRSYLVPASEFDKAIGRLGDDATIEMGEGFITVKKSRYRVRINTLDAMDDFAFIRPSGAMHAVPKTFLADLRTLQPFVSDNATKLFAMAYRLRPNSVTVTDNISISRIDFDGKTPFDHMLPVWAVEKVLSRKESPVTALMFDERSFSFVFEDDSWLRTPLIDAVFPDDVADKLLAAAKAAEQEITNDWREVFSVVSDLCQQTLRILPDRITGGLGQSDTQGEVASPVNGPTAWSLKQLQMIVALATHFDPAVYPKPAPWRGRRAYGVISGKSS